MLNHQPEQILVRSIANPMGIIARARRRDSLCLAKVSDFTVFVQPIDDGCTFVHGSVYAHVHAELSVEQK